MRLIFLCLRARERARARRHIYDRHAGEERMAEIRRGGGQCYGIGLAKIIIFLCRNSSGALCLLIAGNLCVRSISLGGHPDRNDHALTGRTRGNRPPHLDFNTSQEPVTLPLHYRDPNETWSAHCRSKYFYNSTWGKSKAPLVDKNNIKLLLSKEISLPSSPLHELKLIPTLMYLTRENVTNVTFNDIQKIQRPTIVKPTHGSGGTAVIDDTNHFRCFKACEYYGVQRQFHINETSFGLFQDSIWKMANTGFNVKLEPQYGHVARGVIFEEALPSSDFLEYSWWVVYGHPVFAQIICDDKTQNRGQFVTADFQFLDMVGKPMPKCAHEPQEPKTWSSMRSIASELGRQHEMVRVDFYSTGSNEVYFSELTFTSNQCQRNRQQHYKPIEADGLLYDLIHDKINPKDVTPDYVRRLINSKR